MLIVFMTTYGRYRLVAEHLSEDWIHSHRLNKAALVVGVASASGMIVEHLIAMIFINRLIMKFGD